MNNIQRFINQYHDDMMHNIYRYRDLISDLPPNEFEIKYKTHINNWVNKLTQLKNDVYADEIMRMTADVNLQLLTSEFKPDLLN